MLLPFGFCFALKFALMGFQCGEISSIFSQPLRPSISIVLCSFVCYKYICAPRVLWTVFGIETLRLTLPKTNLVNHLSFWLSKCFILTLGMVGLAGDFDCARSAQPSFWCGLENKELVPDPTCLIPPNSFLHGSIKYCSKTCCVFSRRVVVGSLYVIPHNL